MFMAVQIFSCLPFSRLCPQTHMSRLVANRSQCRKECPPKPRVPNPKVKPQVSPAPLTHRILSRKRQHTTTPALNLNLIISKAHLPSPKAWIRDVRVWSLGRPQGFRIPGSSAQTQTPSLRHIQPTAYALNPRSLRSLNPNG